MDPRAMPGTPAWRWFAAWLVLLARRGAARRAIPGLLAGFGVAPLLIAYLNRDGPGNVCNATAGGSSCTEEWSPWPWLIIGCVLLAAGFGAFAMRRRAR
jgi:hypothetical protein